MAARRQICRYENKAVEVEGKLFFNESYSSKESMRRAAKRFAQSDKFTNDCAYYEGRLENGRWQFAPVGTLIVTS
jgi:hypothetical protein